MQRLILYTKQNCHLCDQAEQILQAVYRDIPLEVEQVDIAAPQNITALAKYRERIPVLSRPSRETELDWPFSVADIKAYLAG
jgi:glutaredoxin